MPDTTPLNGEATPVDLGDGFTLSAPGTIGTVLEVAPPRATRGARAPVDQSPIDASLRATGVTEIKTFVVNATVSEPAPPKNRPRTRSAAATPDPMVLEVPPPPDGHVQLVLAIDQDGATSWHLPAPPTGAAPTRGARAKRGARDIPKANVQRFQIGKRFPSAPPAGGARTRGITGRIGKMLLKVLIYPVTDPILGPITEHFARKWETANRPYGVRRFTPEHYREANAEPISAGDWPALAGGRALLFVHGTFSTAHGAFGALSRDAMRTLHERYDGRVFAANVFTLSDDPVENARWIVAQIPKDVRLDVDIVCHSRGGLVARALAQLGAQADSAPKLTVGRIVLVGVPNHGTPLADPDHMMAMIDRFTSALNIAPTGVVTETLEAIVTAVKVIGHGALKSLVGLASMNPTGEFLTRLNRPGSVETEYFAVAADYTPPAEGGLFKLVAERAGDVVVDKVFGDAPNDLVVPTRGVSERNGAPAFPLPAASCFVFPATRGVMHTHYFEAGETTERLLAWLPAQQRDASRPTARRAAAARPRPSSREHPAP